MLNNLTGILLRFRNHELAINANLKAMYHQVRVPEVDAEGLRFLWQNDASGTNPDVYQMLVQILDLTESPCCANYALKKTKKDHRESIEVTLYG